MKTIIELLRSNPQVSDFKVNIRKKESMEMFFVKGKLETVRCTDTCDKEVTVYADHGEYKGDSQFFVYPSTTEAQTADLIRDAVSNALLINNKTYTLPEAEKGSYVVESNFADYTPADLSAVIAKAVFDANTLENASLNSVEIFINKHTETIANSRGLNKTQVRYSAMVEAIPTYNGEIESVELYEQYNFSNLDTDAIKREISQKMTEVKARFEAVKPDHAMECPVILNAQELAQLFMNIAYDLNYASVYSHSNLWSKGDAIQKNPQGDRIGITMSGEAKGSIRSTKFDNDGMSLGSIRVVEDGKALNYHGANRFGQYLGEKPTGSLGCLCVDAGSAGAEVFTEGPYLEIVSMSGLQVESFSDYIGGEIRLAYYHDGEKVTPVTGISISGKLSEVLDHMQLSDTITVYNGYTGPEKALFDKIKVY